MFTGIGGFELGFEKANSRFKCVGFSEIDKFACQVLKHKFPKIKNYGDATKIKPEELPDFDLLCGGFPCQAFSIAGNRQGFKDTRGTLFFEIAKLIKIKKPKIIFLENVKGLLNHEAGQTFRIIVQTLDELGYDVQWMVHNSKFFGVPQNRERVFIIANLRGTSRPEILPFKKSYQKNSKLQGQQANTIETSGASKSYVIKSKQLQETKGNPQGKRIYKTDGIGQTLTTKGGGVIAKKVSFDKNQIRKLTPKECERLQGFPDDWTKYGLSEKDQLVTFSDTQRYKQTGNAVTVNVIKAIGEKLAKVKKC